MHTKCLCLPQWAFISLVWVVNEDLSTGAATWPIALSNLDLRLYEPQQPHDISQHLSSAIRIPSLGCLENHVLILYQRSSLWDVMFCWSYRCCFEGLQDKTFTLCDNKGLSGYTFLTVQIKLYCLYKVGWVSIYIYIYIIHMMSQYWLAPNVNLTVQWTEAMSKRTYKLRLDNFVKISCFRWNLWIPNDYK